MALAECEDGIGHYRSSSTYCASTTVHIRYSGHISLAEFESDLIFAREYPTFVHRHKNEEHIIPDDHHLRDVRSPCQPIRRQAEDIATPGLHSLEDRDVGRLDIG